MTKDEALNTSTNFLQAIYEHSFHDVASLMVMNADEDYAGIVRELVRVREFIDELIKGLNNGE